MVYGVHTNRGTSNGSPFPVRSIRDRRWHYIRNDNHEQQQTNVDNFGPDFKPHRYGILKSWMKLTNDPQAAERIQALINRPAEELYDTLNDPDEQRNLAADPNFAQQRQRLRSQLNTWLQQQGDQPMSTEMSVKPKIRKVTK